MCVLTRIWLLTTTFFVMLHGQTLVVPSGTNQFISSPTFCNGYSDFDIFGNLFINDNCYLTGNTVTSMSGKITVFPNKQFILNNLFALGNTLTIVDGELGAKQVSFHGAGLMSVSNNGQMSIDSCLIVNNNAKIVLSGSLTANDIKLPLYGTLDAVHNSGLTISNKLEIQSLSSIYLAGNAFTKIASLPVSGYLSISSSASLHVNSVLDVQSESQVVLAGKAHAGAAFFGANALISVLPNTLLDISGGLSVESASSLMTKGTVATSSLFVTGHGLLSIFPTGSLTVANTFTINTNGKALLGGGGGTGKIRVQENSLLSVLPNAFLQVEGDLVATIRSSLMLAGTIRTNNFETTHGGTECSLHFGATLLANHNVKFLSGSKAYVGGTITGDNMVVNPNTPLTSSPTAILILASTFSVHGSPSVVLAGLLTANDLALENESALSIKSGANVNLLNNAYIIGSSNLMVNGVISTSNLHMSSAAMLSVLTGASLNVKDAALVVNSASVVLNGEMAAKSVVFNSNSELLATESARLGISSLLWVNWDSQARIAGEVTSTSVIIDGGTLSVSPAGKLNVPTILSVCTGNTLVNGLVSVHDLSMFHEAYISTFPTASLTVGNTFSMDDRVAGVLVGNASAKDMSVQSKSCLSVPLGASLFVTDSIIVNSKSSLILGGSVSAAGITHSSNGGVLSVSSGADLNVANVLHIESDANAFINGKVATEKVLLAANALLSVLPAASLYASSLLHAFSASSVMISGRVTTEDLYLVQFGHLAMNPLATLEVANMFSLASSSSAVLNGQISTNMMSLSVQSSMTLAPNTSLEIANGFLIQDSSDVSLAGHVMANEMTLRENGNLLMVPSARLTVRQAFSMHMSSNIVLSGEVSAKNVLASNGMLSTLPSASLLVGNMLSLNSANTMLEGFVSSKDVQLRQGAFFSLLPGATLDVFNKIEAQTMAGALLGGATTANNVALYQNGRLYTESSATLDVGNLLSMHWNSNVLLRGDATVKNVYIGDSQLSTMPTATLSITNTFSIFPSSNAILEGTVSTSNIHTALHNLFHVAPTASLYVTNVFHAQSGGSFMFSGDVRANDMILDLNGKCMVSDDATLHVANQLSIQNHSDACFEGDVLANNIYLAGHGHLSLLPLATLVVPGTLHVSSFSTAVLQGDVSALNIALDLSGTVSMCSTATVLVGDTLSASNSSEMSLEGYICSKDLLSSSNSRLYTYPNANIVVPNVFSVAGSNAALLGKVDANDILVRANGSLSVLPSASLYVGSTLNAHQSNAFLQGAVMAKDIYLDEYTFMSVSSTAAVSLTDKLTIRSSSSFTTAANMDVHDVTLLTNAVMSVAKDAKVDVRGLLEVHSSSKILLSGAISADEVAMQSQGLLSMKSTANLEVYSNILASHSSSLMLSGQVIADNIRVSENGLLSMTASTSMHVGHELIIQSLSQAVIAAQLTANHFILQNDASLSMSPAMALHVPQLFSMTSSNAMLAGEVAARSVYLSADGLLSVHSSTNLVSDMIRVTSARLVSNGMVTTKGMHLHTNGILSMAPGSSLFVENKLDAIMDSQIFVRSNLNAKKVELFSSSLLDITEDARVLVGNHLSLQGSSRASLGGEFHVEDVTVELNAHLEMLPVAGGAMIIENKLTVQSTSNAVLSGSVRARDIVLTTGGTLSVRTNAQIDVLNSVSVIFSNAVVLGAINAEKVHVRSGGSLSVLSPGYLLASNAVTADASNIVMTSEVSAKDLHVTNGGLVSVSPLGALSLSNNLVVQSSSSLMLFNLAEAETVNLSSRGYLYLAPDGLFDMRSLVQSDSNAVLAGTALAEDITLLNSGVLSTLPTANLHVSNELIAQVSSSLMLEGNIAARTIKLQSSTYLSVSPDATLAVPNLLRLLGSSKAMVDGEVTATDIAVLSTGLLQMSPSGHVTVSNALSVSSATAVLSGEVTAKFLDLSMNGSLSVLPNTNVGVTDTASITASSLMLEGHAVMGTVYAVEDALLLVSSGASLDASGLLNMYSFSSLVSAGYVTAQSIRLGSNALLSVSPNASLEVTDIIELFPSSNAVLAGSMAGNDLLVSNSVLSTLPGSWLVVANALYASPNSRLLFSGNVSAGELTLHTGGQLSASADATVYVANTSWIYDFSDAILEGSMTAKNIYLGIDATLSVLPDASLDVDNLLNAFENSSLLFTGEVSAYDMYLSQNALLHVSSVGTLDVTNIADVGTTSDALLEGRVTANVFTLGTETALLVSSEATLLISDTLSLASSAVLEGTITANDCILHSGGMLSVRPGASFEVPNLLSLFSANLHVEGTVTATEMELSTPSNMIVHSGANAIVSSLSSAALSDVIVWGSFASDSIVLEGNFHYYTSISPVLLDLLEIRPTGIFHGIGGINLQVDTIQHSGTFYCYSRCVLNANSAVLHSGSFLSSGVSDSHQDCDDMYGTTEQSGGNHAGCSSEHACCPSSALSPHGSFAYPRSMGMKGGVCREDSAGRGGGSLELHFEAIDFVSGTLWVQANGESPNLALMEEAAGGGSGGSILLFLPCHQELLDALILEASGGHADSMGEKAAYGGSGGRIAIHCSVEPPADYDYELIVRAYGGMSAMLPNWGAAGTLHVVTPTVSKTYIFEHPSYYGLEVSYYPATFLKLDESELQDVVLNLKTETRSDVFLYAESAIDAEVRVLLEPTFETLLGAVVNSSPELVVVQIDPVHNRPPAPSVPPAAGACLPDYVPSPTSSTTVSVSSTQTPSITSTISVSPTSTAKPSKLVSKTSTPSPTAAPDSCADDCAYPAIELYYPQVPLSWHEWVNAESRSYFGTDGFLHSSDSPNPFAVPKVQLLSEALPPAIFSVRLSEFPAVGERIQLFCRSLPPPWFPDLLDVPPLRLCVVSTTMQDPYARECIASFPYTLSASSPSLSVHVGVNVHASAMKPYLQRIRDALAEFWSYSEEQVELLHNSTLPLPMDFRIQCHTQSSFVRPWGSAASPRYPMQHSLDEIRVVYVPATLPALADILVEQRPGVFRSSIDRMSLNITEKLSPFMCSEEEQHDLPDTCNASVSSTNATLFLREEFLSELRSLRRQAKHFSLTLSGSGNLILLADREVHRTQSSIVEGNRRLYVPDSVLFGDPAYADEILEQVKVFTKNTTVSVQDVLCTINWISPDGTIMSVTTPKYEDLCLEGECDDLTLSISNSGYSIDPVEEKVRIDAVLSSLQRIVEQNVTRDVFMESSTLNTHLSLATLGLKLLPAALSCPPACPQNWTVALQAVPIGKGGTPSIDHNPTLSNGLTIPLGQDVWSSEETPLFIEHYLSTRTFHPLGFQGIRYVDQCYGDYTNVDTGSCVDALDPLSYQCAWGEREYCRTCHTGALCPGGFHLWPRKGYWVASEQSREGIAYPCPNPDATTRCPGWPLDCDPQDPECAYLHSQYLQHGTFPCGRGYRTGSKGCTECDTGYYPTASGGCTSCPGGTAWSTVLLPIVYFFAGIFAVAVVLLAISFVLVKYFGGNISKVAASAIQFILWSWISLQTVVQATRSLGPGAPRWLYFFYSGLSTLQFEGIVAHPHCLKSVPFQTEWSKYGIVMSLYIIVLAYLLMCHRGHRVPSEADTMTSTSEQDCAPQIQMQMAKPQTKSILQAHADIFGKARQLFRRIPRLCIPMVFTVLLLLYATVTNSVLSILSCGKRAMTLRAYFALDGDGATAFSQFDFGPDIWERILSFLREGTVQPNSILDLLDLQLMVSTMRQDTNYVCYEGSHFAAAVASWIVLLVYSLGFPIATFLYVRKYAIRYLSYHLKLSEVEKLRNEWLHILPLEHWRLRRSKEKQGRQNKNRSSSLSGGGGYSSSAVVFHNPLGAADNAARMQPSLTGNLSIVHVNATGDKGVSKAMSNPVVTDRFEKPDDMDGSSTTMRADKIVDGAEMHIRNHALLKPLMTGSFRPSKFYFLHLEKMVVLVLGAVSSLTYQTMHLPSMVIGLCAALPVTLTMAVLHYKHKPFPQAERWKRFVTVYLYGVVSFSLITNFIVFVLHKESAFDSPEVVRSKSAVLFALSLVNFLLCIGLFLLLVLAFLLTLIRDAIGGDGADRSRSIWRQRSAVSFRSPFSSDIPSSASPASTNRFHKVLDSLLSLFFDKKASENASFQSGSVRRNIVLHDYLTYVHSRGGNLASQPRRAVVSRAVFSGDNEETAKFGEEQVRNLAPTRIRSVRSKKFSSTA